jgi:VIT1/CCC1 family predicted Fe2+/Mn2+ transporter
MASVVLSACTLFGLGAAAVTYGIGRLVGTAIG